MIYKQIYSFDNIRQAFRETQSAGRAPGLDGLKIEEVGDEQTFCREIQRKLKTRTYQAQPVRATLGEQKSDGSYRQLSIPCIEDRIVQRAVLAVIGPIIDPTFEDCSYGGRIGRDGRSEMVSNVGMAIKQGLTEAVGLDVSKFFDTIKHSVVLKGLRKLIFDEDVLSLVLQWLQVPRFEQSDYDRIEKAGSQMVDALKVRASVGVSQGSPISGLLANLAGHEIDLDCQGIPGLAYYRYIDDVILLSKSAYIRERGIKTLTESLDRQGLNLNTRKTRRMSLVVDWRTSCNWFGILGYSIQARMDDETSGIVPHIRISDRNKAEFRDKMEQAINEHSSEGVQAVLRRIWWPSGVVSSFVESFPIVAASDDEGDMFDSIIGAWEAAQREARWLSNCHNAKRRNRFIQHNIMEAWGKRVKAHSRKMEKVRRWNEQNPLRPRRVQPAVAPLVQYVLPSPWSSNKRGRRVEHLEHQILLQIINRVAGRYKFRQKRAAGRQLDFFLRVRESRKAV